MSLIILIVVVLLGNFLEEEHKSTLCYLNPKNIAAIFGQSSLGHLKWETLAPWWRPPHLGATKECKTLWATSLRSESHWNWNRTLKELHTIASFHSFWTLWFRGGLLVLPNSAAILFTHCPRCHERRWARSSLVVSVNHEKGSTISTLTTNTQPPKNRVLFHTQLHIPCNS